MFKIFLVILFLILFFFFIYPIILLIYIALPGLEGALLTKSFLESFGLTVLISSAASLVAVVLGVPTAYILTRYNFPFKQIVDALMDIPIVIPHTVVGIMVILAFADYGLGPYLNSLGLKIIDAIPGAIIAVSYLSATYALRSIQSALRLLDPELENVARTLGASPLRSFLYVVLPNISGAIADGALLSWARSVSESGALLVVAYYVILGTRSIYPASIYIYQSYIGVGLADAVKFSAALVLMVISIFLAYRALLGHVRAKGAKG